jgi:nucleoside-diphosphate-sugar epimerase
MPSAALTSHLSTEKQTDNSMKKILITGHCGLVGRHLWPSLLAHGYAVSGLDVADSSGDITDPAELVRALHGCHGVVHLAAVSRVVWGQRNPELCWKTNALASKALLNAVINSSLKPWVIVASSREVYGEAKRLPVTEDAELTPVNIYGKAKLAMEQTALHARQAGINTAIVRLANVYGCTLDHVDRVLPAFCRNAAEGLPLRIDGFEHLFDFTHISDTVAGLMKLVNLLETGERGVPPIHLLPGIGTTLLEAARMAISSAGSASSIIEAPSRNYDVSRFVGDPSRASELLGWQAAIAPQQGIAELVAAFMTQKVRAELV